MFYDVQGNIDVHQVQGDIKTLFAAALLKEDVDVFCPNPSSFQIKFPLRRGLFHLNTYLWQPVSEAWINVNANRIEYKVSLFRLRVACLFGSMFFIFFLGKIFIPSGQFTDFISMSALMSGLVWIVGYLLNLLIFKLCFTSFIEHSLKISKFRW